MYRRSLAPLAVLVASTLILSACGGGGGGGGSNPIPIATPTPAASSTAFTQADFTCPTSDTPTSVVRTAVSKKRAARSVAHRARTTTAGTKLAVMYNRTTATTQAVAIGSREQSMGTTLVRSFDFVHSGTVMHILSVPAARLASVEATMRTQPGVVSVGLTGERRYSTTVNTPLFTTDPYFQGFTAAETGGPATFQVPPFEENPNIPGQWDAHVTGLEDAFGYSVVGNATGGVSNAGAIGLATTHIAIIDTGEDTNHPELTSKIVHQGCFISNPNGVQSTSTFETDPQGHGTDVAGIAAEETGNNYGFSGAGGNSTIFAYRVFPTPDDNCTNDTSTDPQCGSDTTDIAAAIDDAVTNGANVISMSLGGGGCTGDGVDTDAAENAAVKEAIAANVVVVAAAGNESATSLDAPGCDAGVIGVGASAIADGVANGTSATGTTTTGAGSSTNPAEYVASYSNVGTPGLALHSSAAWGIVAPGADPSTADSNPANNGGDLLHWVTNIWTTTPFMANANDTSFAGSCQPDILGESGAIDCQILIAGTSMATPHVAGSAALIISATGGLSSPFQNPAKMKALLCSTADDIQDPNEGCGRLNIYRAMAVALGDPSPPITSSSLLRRP